MIMTQFKRKKHKKPPATKICSGIIVLIVVLMVVIFLSGESKWLSSTTSSIDKHGLNVTRLNEQYKTVDDILQWICQQQQDKLRIVDLTNWGPSSLVILHKLEQLQRLQQCPTIPVVTIDTLHLFPESYTFLQMKKKQMGTNLLIFKPKQYQTADAFDQRYGTNLVVEHPQQYAYWSKVEPMYRALRLLRADAYITGRRRSQGGERSNLQAFELDTVNKQKTKRLKINPLVDWTYEQVWEYIRDNDIPYNPLYDQGYKSLGDVRTTSKVSSDQEERAGRFRGMNQTECGIHNLPMLSSSEEEELMKPKGLQTFIELSLDTLDTVVLGDDNRHRYGKDNVLVVFYHPQCGHCQRFEPSFFAVAQEIAEAPESTILSRAMAARFNIGRYHTPAKLKDIGMEVLGTPAIFLVKHKPSRQVLVYKGIRSKLPLVLWLRKELGTTSSAVEEGKGNSTGS